VGVQPLDLVGRQPRPSPVAMLRSTLRTLRIPGMTVETPGG
jgi:hypothetical protein